MRDSSIAARIGTGSSSAKPIKMIRFSLGLVALIGLCVCVCVCVCVCGGSISEGKEPRGECRKIGVVVIMIINSFWQLRGRGRGARARARVIQWLW